MICDLSGKGQIQDSVDVIVIGGGTVGLPFAQGLAEQGLRVVCLESGGLKQHEETHPLNTVIYKKSYYAGADHGRFRALGGTSSRWGGALIPFQAADLRPEIWPVTMADLEPFVPHVERLFGLDAGPYEDLAFPFELSPNHVNRLAKWPSFARRNVASLMGARVRRDDRISVWLNATVVAIHAKGPGEPVTVTAKTCAGDRIVVTAPRLVIAAGAIETTRLALLLDRMTDGAIMRTSPALGRYFADHLSVGVAEIDCTDPFELNTLIGFRFGKGGAMRNIRFELAPRARARDTLPPGFAHIGFESDEPGGFDALRAVFRSLQNRRVPSLRTLAQLARQMPWLTRAVWWRFVHRRLLFPADCRLIVHIVAEQEARSENCIKLSTSQCDQLGVPLAEVSWNVDHADRSNVEGLAALFESTWNTTGFATLGRWRGYDSEGISRNLHNSAGIYHPTGSTRMARSASEGVVDAQLRIFALPQVRLLATSVLPTGGGANPTMMLMLLAMRCLESMAAETRVSLR